MNNMQITPYRTALFKLNDNLPAFIGRHITQLHEQDILVVSSKLICLWKGCATQYKSAHQKENLIRQESAAALKTKLAWLTIKSGMVMTNGGVDESNANGQLLWLPRDLYACAEQLRRDLKKLYGLKKLGVIITDSMILPLRAGVIGAAVAYSGFTGVRDERGKKDIFGKPLKTTLVNLADGLAAAAAVTMGERNEQTPLCVIQNAPVKFVSKTNPSEISYPPEQDLYAPLFKAVKLTVRRKK
ncbi:MAG: coenzyme F420-0:L-glutamate ligase [Elusimicrobiaceae bacterium]|nr:coenzyme F420-0:L-glutamate ligase [Elusimicrobiaceae bacterium]